VAGERTRVVVVGGGFGGLAAVKGLKHAEVDVTLVDRQNYHLFQPLAYQVATGGLSAAEIATPLRRILRRQRNVRVVLAEVSSFDLERRRVYLGQMPNGADGVSLEYDELVVAGGSAYSYFGHEAWTAHAPELKSLAGALDLRSRILSAFEAAEVEADEEKRRGWLSFVVVGAGPTGVEMAGQIAELARDVLHRDFRDVDTRAARVLLVEAGPRVLSAFPPTLSRRAEHALERLGVNVRLETTVVGVDAGQVALQRADGSIEEMPARTAVWAAGVTASPLAAALASASGAEVDRVGRIVVEPDLTIRGRPEVHALGDMVAIGDGTGATQPLPGVAPVAMQQGRYVAHAIRGAGAVAPFRYRNKGDLATIGRSRAVAVIKGVKLSGFPAWVIWLVVHITYLIGFENRLIVLLRWGVSYVTRNRGARLIGRSEL
jgi:NADH dehydrogenase